MSYSGRNAALNILGDVENGAFLNLSLKKYLGLIKKPEDKRFATALVSTTLENLFRIDYVISCFTTGKKTQKVIKNILRLGVCQLMYFESVPVSAAVNESVKLCQKCGKSQLKGFINGVLRNVSSNLGNVEYPDAQSNKAEYLSILYSYPKWICEKFIFDYGFDRAEDMLSYKGDDSYTCIRVCNEKKADFSDFYVKDGQYCKNVKYIKNLGSVEQWDSYKNGSITVQGESSVVCVDALGLCLSDMLFDVCAAPGGKSVYAAKKCSSVLSADLYEHRTLLINKNIERLGIKNVTARCMDASEYYEEFDKKFDAVLIDAPCSALGLLYRKPDIKINKKSDDLENIIKMQQKILNNSSRYVKNGGKLLYSTCTINNDENIENIKRFLKENSDFEIDDMTNDLPDGLKNRVSDGCIQLYPDIDKIDGFFIARLRRK